MAELNRYPAPWVEGMGDGCTGVLDWLPFIGDMGDDCDRHDERYHYGGDRAAKQAADEEFRANLRNNAEDLHWLIRWAGRPIVNLIAEGRFWGVQHFANSAWNWVGPGMPVDEPSYQQPITPER